MEKITYSTLRIVNLFPGINTTLDATISEKHTHQLFQEYTHTQCVRALQVINFHKRIITKKTFNWRQRGISSVRPVCKQKHLFAFTHSKMRKNEIEMDFGIRKCTQRDRSVQFCITNEENAREEY